VAAASLLRDNKATKVDHLGCFMLVRVVVWTILKQHLLILQYLMLLFKAALLGLSLKLSLATSWVLTGNDSSGMV
jgi:hypothetical protein